MPALTAELDCFERVEGLDVLPMEMGLIAPDLGLTRPAPLPRQKAHRKSANAS